MTFSLNSLLILCLSALSFAAVAQEETRTLSFSNFDRLDMGSAFVINVSQGSGYKITATGRKQDLDELEAKVTNSTLHVGYKDRTWNKNRERVTFTITMPKLRGLAFSGASRSSVKGFRDVDQLDLDISGASNAEIEVDAARVNADFSGASTVVLTGKATRMQSEISGATSLKAYDLKLAEASVEASGASKAQLFVTERLQADASGASSIRYRGGASNVRSNTSGAGSVRSEN